MVKKAKKKARSGHIDKRPVNSSSKDTISSINSVTNDETTKDGVVVVVEKRICPHIDKGVNLDKVSEKFKSSEPLRCEDCRESVVDRKVGKGKGKQGKKKCGGESKAVWVCLGCGHFSCGGAGFPTTPQSHAVRHARQYHHPLAVQFQNPQLRWCFPCNTIIPIEKAKDGGETKDPLCDVMKLIKGRSQTPAADVEDVWFGTGSVTSGISSETSASTINRDVISGYMARGLMNLGNTCFFNSVMQNLLAMDKLRDYFCKFEGSLGPLTMSLKKLFMETNPEAGLRNVINPKSFFGCVCAKAPQFRGYQQHDSHELLRCLLDAWCTEELNARKQKKSSVEECKSPQTDPIFVDSIFGGQLSSTVSCLECCHSSTVYEPFLDISLPVPTKKPPSKKPQPVSRSKKPNPPPKRSARIRSKVSNNSTVSSDQCASKQSTKNKSFSQLQSKEDAVDEKFSATDDCASLEISKTISTTNEKCCDLQNNLMDQDSDSKPGKDEAGELLMPTNDTTWLDFLSPDALLNEKNKTPGVCSYSVNHVVDKEDGELKSTLDSSNEVIPSGTYDAISPNDLTWMDFCEPGQLLDGDDMASQISLGSSTQDPATENVSLNVGLNSASANSVPFSGSNVDDEVPLKVQDSAIILLPYEDNTPSEILGEGEGSSPVVGCDNQISDFDGFGGLFDEPESEVATLESSDEKAVQSGIIFAQSSESDHEVDDSDAPVSIDRCLSYFIKPEFLSKDEHAWKCENCSKLRYEQKMKLKKAVLNPKSDTMINGCKETNARVGFIPSEKQHVSTELGNLCNGTVVKDIPLGDDAVQLSLDAELNSNTNGRTETREEATKSEKEDGKHEKEDSDCNPSESSCSNELFLPHNRDNTESENVQGVNDSMQLLESKSIFAGSQSKRSEDEETDSEYVKVKRDATKKILINRAPPILTIHLKRFYQDARGRLNKLRGHIGFRDTIDIGPYIDPSNKRDDYKYRLLGVVEHSGSMRGGHYVAYVRGGKKSSSPKMENEGGDFKWYHASDAHVHEVKLEEVLRCEAYILFYEKI